MKFIQSAGWLLAFGLFGCSAGAPDASTGSAVESQSEDLKILRLCDGPLHLTCAKGQYCNAIAQNHCPGQNTIGVCAAKREVCTDLFDPVCGCDGQTYSNSCFAGAVGVAVEHTGACQPKAPFCGGIAAFPCPGVGKCIDDPSDNCDPKAGGADCGGICSCVQNVLCVRGSHFDNNPNVCSCVSDAPVKAPFCGGIAGIACPGMGKCIDDPSDNCDPKAGGADCGGICSCVQNVLCARGSHFDNNPNVCSCVSDAPAK